VVGAYGSVGTNVNALSENQGAVNTFGSKGPNAQAVASQTNSASSQGAYGASEADFGSASNSAANYKSGTADAAAYGNVQAQGLNGAGAAGISNTVFNTQAGYKQQLSATNQAQGIGGIVVTNSQGGAGVKLGTNTVNSGIASYSVTQQKSNANSVFSGYGDNNSFNNGAAATQQIGVAIGAKGTVTSNKNTGVIFSNAGASNLVGQYQVYGQK